MQETTLSIREFYGKVWAEYADPVHHPITAKALETQSRIVSHRIAQAMPRRVLDLGCGPEPAVPARTEGQVVYGDLVFEILRRVKEESRRHVVCLDARHLPFPDRCFDFLWCGLLADHIPDPEPWLQELFRVLTPGAHLGIACWQRSTLPTERYPADRMMRYNTAAGEQYLVASYPTWHEVLATLAATDPEIQVDSFPVVPDEYVLQVAWLRAGGSSRSGSDAITDP